MNVQLEAWLTYIFWVEKLNFAYDIVQMVQPGNVKETFQSKILIEITLELIGILIPCVFWKIDVIVHKTLQ